jgi:hypothetical protein
MGSGKLSREGDKKLAADAVSARAAPQTPPPP